MQFVEGLFRVSELETHSYGREICRFFVWTLHILLTFVAIDIFVLILCQFVK